MLIVPRTLRQRFSERSVRIATLSALISIVLLVMLLVLMLAPTDARAALGSLIGVVIGGGITTATNIFTAREARKTQLGLSTWTKRIETHQEAFVLWIKIASTYGHSGDEHNRSILDAQDWWNKHCLFLSREAREAFRNAYLSANEYNFYQSKLTGADDDEVRKEIRKIRKEIREAGPLILRTSGADISDELLRDMSKKELSKIETDGSEA